MLIYEDHKYNTFTSIAFELTCDYSAVVSKVCNFKKIYSDKND